MTLLANHNGQRQCNEPIKTQMNKSTSSLHEVQKKMSVGTRESHRIWLQCYLDVKKGCKVLQPVSRKAVFSSIKSTGVTNT